LNSAEKRDSGINLLEFLALELLLELYTRNVDTVNNDSRILREEVKGAGEVLVVGGFVDRGDVVLGPLSQSRPSGKTPFADLQL